MTATRNEKWAAVVTRIDQQSQALMAAALRGTERERIEWVCAEIGAQTFNEFCEYPDDALVLAAWAKHRAHISLCPACIAVQGQPSGWSDSPYSGRAEECQDGL